jgi:4'-phosphopantetheinyl transferase
MVYIQVHCADLTRLSMNACLALLDGTERQRALCLSDPRAMEEFVKTRALLRRLLAQHTGRPADALEITTAVSGKPMLLDSGDVHFNISHSQGRALVAISSAEIGIDIERIDCLVDYWGVANSVFSRCELELLRSVPETRKLEAFFSLWTRKEAYLKATGRGFSANLALISVASTRSAIADHAGAATEQPWFAFDLPVPAGFKAALVTVTRACTIDVVHVPQVATLDADRP